MFVLVVLTFSSLCLGSIYCPAGDLNDDCEVNLEDVVVFAEQWLDVGGCSGFDCADFDGSGKVVSDDFAVLSGNWSKRIGPAIITEFMASNSDNLDDEDGDSSDWIELFNPTDTAVDLEGWCLTHDPLDLEEWEFPAVTLGPGGFLTVFASQKDRRNPDPNKALHTNFNLDQGGDYLALVKPDGQTIVQEYSPEYPDQRADISYGLGQFAQVLVRSGASATSSGPTWTSPCAPAAACARPAVRSSTRRPSA